MALLGACSVLEPDRINYKSAGKSGAPLEVPPDLSQLPDQSRYAMPAAGGGVSASDYQAGQAAAAIATANDSTAASAIADVRFMRSGSQRWLRVDRPADTLWDPLRDFWLDNGFLLAIDQPTMGIMETDWAENRAKLPQDVIRETLGKLFDSLYSTGERDKFRTRVERNANGGTDIFIAHKGMQEVFDSRQQDHTVWRPRATDPELEIEFLRRLMVRLGVSQEQARVATAQEEQAAASSPARAASARLLEGGAGPVIELDEDFDRAWRRLSLALDRTGFTVEDRNRSEGLFFVRYVDPGADTGQPGFFGRLFGQGTAPLPTARYRVVLQAGGGDGGSAVISVQDANGDPAPASDARRILKIIVDDLQ
ncbi:MAG: outer membrane protein assembly factor BamC [Burkholderiaceae bacterium]|jgi:outer membrane protein assembly factor BamC|nr:outer membrane protein assembly factor BamC [Burkholderiaceae bacterium]